MNSVSIKRQRQVLLVLNYYIIRPFLGALLGVRLPEVGSHLHCAVIVWSYSAYGHAILGLGVEIDALSIVLGVEFV